MNISILPFPPSLDCVNTAFMLPFITKRLRFHTKNVAKNIDGMSERCVFMIALTLFNVREYKLRSVISGWNGSFNVLRGWWIRFVEFR